MSNNPILINGVSFKPSSIAPEDLTFGTDWRADNGDGETIVRGRKLAWQFDWRVVPKSVRDQVRAVGRLSGAFIYIDEDAVSYTVIAPLNCCTWDVSAEESDPDELYYNISLRLEER